MRWVLFWVMTISFVVIFVATFFAVFFGFGKLDDVEKTQLFRVFIIEIGVAISALFYSLFGIRSVKNSQHALLTTAALGHGVEAYQACFVSPLNPNTIITTRRNFCRMEKLVAVARKEIFIIGINLESCVSIVDSIAQKTKEGVNFRFLAIDPCGSVLEPMSLMSNIDPEIRRSKIVANLDLLQSMLSAQAKQGSWAIKVINEPIPAGCVGIDLPEREGLIIAQHYLCRIDTENSPILMLSQDLDEFWYNIYRMHMNNMWHDAKEYSGFKKSNPI